MFKYSKDRISVTTVIDTRRAKIGGKYPIKVKVSYLNDRRYYSTSQNLSLDEWDKLPITKVRELIKIRENIENSFIKVRDTVAELVSDDTFSFDRLNQRLKHAAIHTLNDAFRIKIEELKRNEQVGTMIHYETTLKSIERFYGTNIKFEYVSVSWLKQYEAFLRSEEKRQTTISMYTRNIRTVFNAAVESGILRPSLLPFGKGKYRIQEGEGRKLALTIEQIGQIANYEDGSLATEKYRDYWFFLYLCNGINVADMVKLKYRNIINGEICYVRQKTERTAQSRKEICVPITTHLQKIIERWGNPSLPDNYIFPILSGDEDAFKLKYKTKYFTRAINRRMGVIGINLGIGNISTYTARHSFATVLKRAGINIAYISESLGHKDLKTTEHYLSKFEQEERMKNSELLTGF
jgi:integrase